MNSCSICQKHKSKNASYILTTNNFCIYHGPIESNILGYIYIESSRHIEYWSQLTLKEQRELGQLISDIELILVDKFSIERMYTVSIAEAVRHFHIHLIPRTRTSKKGLELIQQATQQDVPSNSPIVNSDDISDLIKVLKRELNSVRE